MQPNQSDTQTVQQTDGGGTVASIDLLASKRLTLEQWQAEGQRLFGESQLKWRFRCPACGNAQAVEDFRPYKAQGVTAETARFNCIGRYKGAKRRAFSDDGEGPCDYTSGGLFDIRPLKVVLPSGEELRTFDFARALSHER